MLRKVENRWHRCEFKIAWCFFWQDPRFDDEVDKITGYHTDSLLCMPVKNACDEVIAVAQVVNKNLDNDQGYFTAKDEKVRRQFHPLALKKISLV